MHNLAVRIDKSTDFFLGALENKVIDFVHEGKLQEGDALLDGSEYAKRRQDYSNDVHSLAVDTSTVLSQTLSGLARTISYTVYLGIIVIVILPVAWYFSFRSVRRWHEELENARTALVANEKQLQQFISEIDMSRTEAVKANAIKSEFLANMSHELRTPLNSILGMLRLLKESKLPEEEHGLVDTAHRSSANLLEIVNDILDLSKIEAGEMQLEKIGVDVIYALDNVVHTLSHTAHEKHIALYLHKDMEAFPYVLGDPVRLIRVLTNLIGNAIKYTDEGRVDVSASYKKLDDKHIEFHCEITDTGIGVPAEKLQTIFEKFSQADTSTTRKYGGTGLGLAITKQLVEMMGGTIGVDSEVGAGSTFWFAIPFEVTDKLSEEKYVRRRKMLSGVIPPETARVLVAEDHPMNQELMTKLLGRFGIGTFEIAGNGEDALKRYGEDTWDLILMDCHMPKKNGYDTTMAIRRIEEKTGAHVPIIAMTANAMVGDREKCLRCGMDEYVSKPVNIEELKEVMGQWIYFKDLADSRAARVPPPVPTTSAPVDLSVLRTYTEGDADMERSLMTIFVDQSDLNLKTLADMSTDIGLWNETAHMFKGSSLGIGANVLAGLCNEAQHFKGKAQEQAVLFEKIKHEYARVKDHLKKIGLIT